MVDELVEPPYENDTPSNSTLPSFTSIIGSAGSAISGSSVITSAIRAPLAALCVSCTMIIDSIIRADIMVMI